MGGAHGVGGSGPAVVTAQEFKAAFDAGRAAFAAEQPTSTNPYRPERVHPLDPPPAQRQTVLAATWLRGWRKDMPAPQELDT